MGLMVVQHQGPRVSVVERAPSRHARHLGVEEAWRHPRRRGKHRRATEQLRISVADPTLEREVDRQLSTMAE